VAEQIKAEERLARFVAGLSPHHQQEMLMALQGYHEEWYNDLVRSDAATILRAQGKVQAMEALNKTIMNARNIVSTIDNRRDLNKPKPIQPAASMM